MSQDWWDREDWWKTKEWKSLRRDCLRRDNYCCQRCGVRKSNGRGLTIHHIIPRAEGGPHHLDNLMTLCKPCHDLVEGQTLNNKPAVIGCPSNPTDNHPRHVGTDADSMKYDENLSAELGRLRTENRILQEKVNVLEYRVERENLLTIGRPTNNNPPKPKPVPDVIASPKPVQPKRERATKKTRKRAKKASNPKPEPVPESPSPVKKEVPPPPKRPFYAFLLDDLAAIGVNRWGKDKRRDTELRLAARNRLGNRIKGIRDDNEISRQALAELIHTCRHQYPGIMFRIVRFEVVKFLWFEKGDGIADWLKDDVIFEWNGD